MQQHDIIIISSNSWEHYTWRRRHHVAWNLARDHRVLFIEPPLTLAQPFYECDLSWRHLLNLGKLKYQGRNLYSYSPWKKFPLGLPFNHLFDYDRLNQASIMQEAKKVVDKLGFKDPILWIYFNQYQYDYFGLFNEKIVVTDWFDQFTAPGRQNYKEIVDLKKSKTDALLKKADMVFAVSRELASYLKQKNENVYFMPHGVDVESFKNVVDPGSRALKRLMNIKRPRLCFMGIMHYVVDFDLLNYVAEANAEWSIMLLGGKWLKEKEDMAAFRKLISRKNVHYLGEIEKELIPAYLKYADVCLMPFKKIEHIWYSAPLKLWEYLAAGKPIVSVNHGMGLENDMGVYLADSYAGYVKMIEKALGDRENTDMAKERLNKAMSNSWSSRVEEMMKLINAHLDQKVK